MRLYSLLLLLGMSIFAHAQQFPQLTGRVVDNANMLSAETRRQLTTLLEEHENTTSNQVVVVTMPTIDGYEISDYGYKLGRHWQIGQAEKDNGALLLVAQQERKIRIEVGYGLEGALTDALSSQIIRNEISPLFKQGKFDEGIVAGTQSMLNAIKGEYTPSKTDRGEGADNIDKIVPFVLFGAFGGQFLAAPFMARRRNTGRNTGRNAKGEKEKDSKQSMKTLALSGGTGLLTGGIATFILASAGLGIIAGVGAALLSLFINGGGSGGGGLGGGRGGYYGGGRRGGGGFGGGGFGGGGGGFGGGGASGGW